MDIQQLVQCQAGLQCSICHPTYEPIHVNTFCKNVVFHNHNEWCLINRQFIEEVKSRRQWAPYVRPSNDPIDVLELPKNNFEDVTTNNVFPPSNEPIYVTIAELVEEKTEASLNQSDFKIIIENDLQSDSQKINWSHRFCSLVGDKLRTFFTNILTF